MSDNMFLFMWCNTIGIALSAWGIGYMYFCYAYDMIWW